MSASLGLHLDDVVRSLISSSQNGDAIAETDIWRALNQEEQNEVLQRVHAAGKSNPEPIPSGRAGKKRKAAAELDPPQAAANAVLPSQGSVGHASPIPRSGVELTPLALTQLQAACKRALGGRVTAPPGTHFYANVRLMLCGSGDSCDPEPAAAVLLEKDALAYVVRVLRALRAVIGGDRSTVRVGDFARVLPMTLRLYLRWKLLKGMAQTREEGMAADAGSGREEGAEEGQDEQGSDVDASNEDFRPQSSESPDGRIPAEDEEESAQLALLQAQAEEAIRSGEGEGVGESGGGEQGNMQDGAGIGIERHESASAAGTRPTDTNPLPVPSPSCADTGVGIERAKLDLGLDSRTLESDSMRVFRARLAFANARSTRLSTEGYSDFAHAREAGFVTRHPSSGKRFAACLPGPAVSRTVLEALAYMAYDRVASIVENANKYSHGGVLTPLDPRRALAPGVSLSGTRVLDRLPLSGYAAALATAPALPEELESRVSTLRLVGAARATGEGLRAARLAEVERTESESEVSRERVLAARLAWASTGGRDVEGEAAFLAVMHGANKPRPLPVAQDDTQPVRSVHEAPPPSPAHATGRLKSFGLKR